MRERIRRQRCDAAGRQIVGALVLASHQGCFFQFFAADGQILMHVEPVTSGAKFSFQR